MTFNPKTLVSNYFKKKKPFSIVIDVLFVVLLVLLILPATRKDVSSFFIRMTSLPPSTLDSEEQFTVNANTMDWQLINFEGQQTNFQELSNKPIFLNIWATWCPPCVAELPGILDLYEEYGDRVHFIIVSNEKPNHVHDFLKDHDYSQSPFYLSATIPQDFASNSIPATYIIDADGRVRVNKKGAARWNSDTTRDLLDEMLNQ